MHSCNEQADSQTGRSLSHSFSSNISSWEATILFMRRSPMQQNYLLIIARLEWDPECSGRKACQAPSMVIWMGARVNYPFFKMFDRSFTCLFDQRGIGCRSASTCRYLINSVEIYLKNGWAMSRPNVGILDQHVENKEGPDINL